MKTPNDPRHVKRQHTVQELFKVEFHAQPVSERAALILSHKILIDEMVQKAAPEFPLEKINKIDLAIPANDDATKSIAIIVNYLTAAIAEGLQERQANKDEDDSQEDGNNENEAKARRLEQEAQAEGGRGRRGGRGTNDTAAPGAGAPKRRVPGPRRPAGK